MNAISNVYVSGHAAERIKERYGVKSKKKIQHLCDKAYERGVKSENSKGTLRDWIDRKSRPGSVIICYQELAFVFSTKAECITVLQIPPAVKKNMKKNTLPA